MTDKPQTARERMDGLALDIDIASQRLVDQVQVMKVIKEALDAEWDAALLAARSAAMACRSHDEVPAKIRSLLRGSYP